MLEHDDNMIMALSGITAKNSEFFSVVQYAQMTRTYGFRTRLMLEYHMSLDLTNHKRNAFTFVAVLGEVGGLYGLLVSVASTFLSFATYQRAENDLASQLYYQKDENARLLPQK